MEIKKIKITIGEVEYETLEAAYKAHKDIGISLNGFYVRYRRGDRGQNLVRAKGTRKNSLKNTITERFRFSVGKYKFKYKNDAYAFFNIKECTYQARIRAGWSEQEAFNLVPRKDGRKGRARLYDYKGRKITLKEMSKISGRPQSTLKDRLNRGVAVVEAMKPKVDWSKFKQSQSNYWLNKPKKNKNLNKNQIVRGKKYNNIAELSKSFGKPYYLVYQRIINLGLSPEEAVTKKDKKIFVDGNNFKSIAAAARHYGKNPNCVYAKLAKNFTLEQALGLEFYETSKTFWHADQHYASQKEFAIKSGLKPTQFSKELKRQKGDVKKTLDAIVNKITIKGRVSEKLFETHPEYKNVVGVIYIALMNFPNIFADNEKYFVKIGVTRDLEQRKRNLKYVKDIYFSSNDTYLYEVVSVETKILRSFNHKRTNKLTARDCEGFTEVLELTKRELGYINIFVRRLLKQNKAPITCQIIQTVKQYSPKQNKSLIEKI